MTSGMMSGMPSGMIDDRVQICEPCEDAIGPETGIGIEAENEPGLETETVIGHGPETGTELGPGIEINAAAKTAPKIEPKAKRARGEVVKLDRKFPLVEIAGIGRVRCEHATELIKGKGPNERAAIGDIVEVSLPESHTVGVIEHILPRRTSFIRRDPQEREMPQVLAANFDQVLIVQPINRLNLKRLERELVLAHETGANVAILLTKADLVDGDSDATISAIRGQVQDLAGQDVQVLVMSRSDDASIKHVRHLMAGKTTILIGKSGVGKSTLVNILLGEDARATGDIRARDGKGRHTTVSREIIALPDYPESNEDEHRGHYDDRPFGPHDAECRGFDRDVSRKFPEHECSGNGIEPDGHLFGIGSGGRIVDMPGVRGLGLWEAEDGIETAFADIEERAAHCRFRDCRHGAEPGCAVREAVESGAIPEARLASYLSLKDELSRNSERRRRSSWKNR